ncbi:hypothetical protein EVAR_45395_1 [Eumeta japonica]|uniref:Uncharacterized protein n=1 Tax=Eumeta variegata TaxID=151549 RepID=A0A4C1WSI2_EUMVA|nr:hypothetical protein EVAR_45395_1 [Eumeta japonica]
MSMTPFPEEDLAKLVLGYLAEQQLMTIYDEFLQASPYLDAVKNEYGRIFMTSLRTILAEYRAVKIYRSRSAPVMDGSDREYYTSASLPQNYRCEREERNSNQYDCQTTSSMTEPYETRIPSNVPYSTAPKLYDQSARLLETSVQVQNMNEVSNVITTNSTADHTMNYEHPNNHQKQLETSKTLQELASRVEGRVLRHAPSAFTKFTKSVTPRQSCVSRVFLANSRCTLAAIDFPKNFRSTVTYCNSNYVQETSTSSHNMPPKTSTNSNLLLQIANVENSDAYRVNGANQTIDVTKIKTNENTHQTNSGDLIKPAEQKVAILSNIRIQPKPLVNTASNKSNSFVNTQSNVPPPSRTLSTTLHTIYVNGTPAYKPDEVGRTFTKDEIMAMPTLILVPVKGIPSSASSDVPLTNITSTTAGSTETAPTTYLPLKIDIESSDSKNQANRAYASKQHKDQILKQNDHKIIKGTENVNNDNAVKKGPQEDIVHDLTKTSTPCVACEIVKSSSTPRRTSHIRVLDFNTPNQVKENETIKRSDLLLTQSSETKSLPILETATVQVNTKLVNDTITKVSKGKAKVKKSESEHNKTGSVTNTFLPPKTNWDTQLRALAVLSEPQDEQIKKNISKCAKTKNKQKKTKNTSDNDVNTKASDKIKHNRKNKLKKSKENDEESNDELSQKQTDSVEVPVKPTINIITDRKAAPNEKNIKGVTNDIQDTPEMDKSTIQTAFNAKLNISDLFETPYKQALYDIQMDTPKFLAPDIPGEPISDVKIMNIPTPMFLSTPRLAITPKLTQTTPGSYASRPTDYSSGGSYYKPDDQDYARVIDDVEGIPISEPNVTGDNSPLNSENTENTEISKTNRVLRPTRRCTKNVSYYDSPISTAKKKPLTESETINHSDSSTKTNFSIDNTSINKNNKSTKKTNKKSQGDSFNSDSIKKKLLLARKKKSPVKKTNIFEKSPFIKIKPRRPTPTKCVKSKRKSPILSQKESARNLIKKRSAVKNELTVTVPHLSAVLTKSRRKSSTPRKIDCTEELNSDSSSNISPGSKKLASTGNVPGKNLELCSEDADTPHLHWSDDGSQDSKQNDPLEVEDITKIKEYIVSTELNKNNKTNSIEGNNDNESLHDNLVKRGFDIETAKSIERDLLENSPPVRIADKSDTGNTTTQKTIESDLLEKGISDKGQNETETDNFNTEKVTETGNNGSTLLTDRHEEDLDDCVEFIVSECNEGSNNYFEIIHDEGTNELVNVESSDPPVRLKDSYCMEACMEDGVTIRLKLTACTLLFNEESDNEGTHNSPLEPSDIKEIENAVTSISCIDKLYTPRKDPMSNESQCIEILDSPLEIIDTSSLETDKNKEADGECTEITLEIEPIIETSSDSASTTKKRKRNQNEKNPEELPNDSKRSKTETQYLASIQNFDIESVLTKLHGS